MQPWCIWIHSFQEIFVVGSVTLQGFLASLVPLTASWKHRNKGLKIVLKYSILSLLTKFHSLAFQLRQNENFSVLECEIEFWEIQLGILGALRSWLPFITFTKLIELRFAEFALINVLLNI